MYYLATPIFSCQHQSSVNFERPLSFSYVLAMVDLSLGSWRSDSYLIARSLPSLSHQGSENAGHPGEKINVFKHLSVINVNQDETVSQKVHANVYDGGGRAKGSVTRMNGPDKRE